MSIPTAILKLLTHTQEVFYNLNYNELSYDTSFDASVYTSKEITSITRQGNPGQTIVNKIFSKK